MTNNDFIEYWSAARLLLNNGNAYSPVELFAMQQSAGWSEATALLMWNPPWTLVFLMPFGLLDHDTAQFTWFVIHCVMVFLGAQLLWQIYAGTGALSRVAWIALLSFPPVYFVLLIGQIAPLVLADVVGFLAAVRRRAWFWAGACLAVASITPHLLYLLWLFVLLWVWQERRWQVGAGFAVMFAIMLSAPLLFDRLIYTRYLTLLSDRSVVLPEQWATPTLGTAVNVLLGGRNNWLRWLPSVGGVFWMYRYWQGKGDRWDWSVELPLILMVSVVTAPFSWTYDYIVLLPAVMKSVVSVRALEQLDRAHGYSAIYLLVCLSLMFSKIFVRNDFWYFWVTPILLLYVSLNRRGSARHDRMTPVTI